MSMNCLEMVDGMDLAARGADRLGIFYVESGEVRKTVAATDPQRAAFSVLDKAEIGTRLGEVLAVGDWQTERWFSTEVLLEELGYRLAS
jgi:hypothetical protein